MKYGRLVPLQLWERHYKPLPVGYGITVGGRQGSELTQGTMCNRERHYRRGPLDTSRGVGRVVSPE